MAVDRRSLDRAPPPAPPSRRALCRAGFRVGHASTASSDGARSQAAVSDARISRQELAAVAAALLLPIPLLAASGLRFPLPGVIERGVASLTPAGGFDIAVVDAAPARPDSEPAARSDAEPARTAAAEDSHAASSAALAPDDGTASARNEKREQTTAAETDSPSPPNPHTDDETTNPHTDDETTPGGGDGNPRRDTPELTAAAPVDSADVETGVTIDAETAGASLQIAVTDNGVAVDTGGDADVGPPVEVPLAPPNLPLP
jgi:hypothetical protein